MQHILWRIGWAILVVGVFCGVVLYTTGGIGVGDDGWVSAWASAVGDWITAVGDSASNMLHDATEQAGDAT